VERVPSVSFASRVKGADVRRLGDAIMSTPEWVLELVKAVQRPRLAFAGLVGCVIGVVLAIVWPGKASVQPAYVPWLVLGGVSCAALLLWDLGAALISSM